MRTALCISRRRAGSSAGVLVLLVAAMLGGSAGGCSSRAGRIGADAGAAAASADAGAQGGGEPVMAGACGPIGPWGDWPPEDAPAREPLVLAPRFERPDCGPGCRLVTTRWNDTGSGKPDEMRLSGRLLTQRPIDLRVAVVTNLDTLEEYDVEAVLPEPGVKSYSAALSRGCLVQQFTFLGETAQREYVCQSCVFRQAHRGLWFGAGSRESPNLTSVVTASDHFVVLQSGRDETGQPLGIWVLDLRDGGRHTIATSGWLVWNISLVEPYVVLSEGDGEVHLIDTRDWSDRNVSNDPALQYMAASDGKTIVWIDQRYHPGGTLEQPANQEVVAYDIATGVLRRLTYTTEERPSAKWNPAVEGDWVVWEDDRDSIAPNSGYGGYKDRMDIYGFHLATGKEYHVLGNQAGTLPEEAHSSSGMLAYAPRLHKGKLYVRGLWRVADRPVVQIWEFELPEP